MASDVMAVRLHLPQVRVLGVLEDAPGALRVSVESTFRRLRCPQCGFRCHRVHDRRDKKVRDLEVSRRRTVLVWSRRMAAAVRGGTVAGVIFHTDKGSHRHSMAAWRWGYWRRDRGRERLGPAVCVSAGWGRLGRATSGFGCGSVRKAWGVAAAARRTGSRG